MPTKRSSSRASRKSTKSGADSAPASPAPPSPAIVSTPAKTRAKSGGATTFAAFKQQNKFINYLFAIHLAIGILFVPLMLLQPQMYHENNVKLSVMFGQDLESAQAVVFDPVNTRFGGVAALGYAILLPILGMMAKTPGEVLTALRAEFIWLGGALVVGGMYANAFRCYWMLIVISTLQLITYGLAYDKVVKHEHNKK